MDDTYAEANEYKNSTMLQYVRDHFKEAVFQKRTEALFAEAIARDNTLLQRQRACDLGYGAETWRGWHRQTSDASLPMERINGAPFSAIVPLLGVREEVPRVVVCWVDEGLCRLRWIKTLVYHAIARQSKALSHFAVGRSICFPVNAVNDVSCTHLMSRLCSKTSPSTSTYASTLPKLEPQPLRLLYARP